MTAGRRGALALLAAYLLVLLAAVKAQAADWLKIHRCEQPSSWTVGGTFQGGLGIYYANWDRWAGKLGLSRRYPDAGMAPPAVQIMVADWAYRNESPRPYWGCFARVGRP